MSGWTDADFEKPIITIGSPWTNANPCNNKVWFDWGSYNRATKGG